ncbi:DUF4937 domain-containing protein [Bacillus clarus]|uniref:Antibiotic biosynthesis monooxygenase family protein n=1 Tax=Bacillus clarus TaxID=2338372 RepID=A0A090YY25_9BACI|nr:DUF4937 domain-containing protein [Bacillus clarus]KFN03277.1 antibiotic biosynthesis monooxygenase family protein [Bacillus clarus]RFT67609.1 DUF4937 domain-containing protein [Bacillus clarus]
MLLKTIFCKVEKEKRDLFSNAQEKWCDLRHLEGFHGQFGGWDEDEACVFSVWESMHTYQAFMNGVHDTIFLNSNQEDTYVSCEIEKFQTLYDITSISFMDAVAKGSFVRITICDVKNGNEQHFLHVQETIWNKGMENVEGMLGGVVGRSITNSNRYIVLSYWQGKMAHQRYVKEIFPALYKLANVKEYVENINGKQVICNEEWSIVGLK